MKHLHTTKFALAWSLFAILLLSMSIVQAQDGANLLTNPGFESPYTSKGGSPERFVANGWEPWHVPRAAGDSESENQQPEYEETSPDTSRIRSGNNAQRYFSFFATHTGGVYQRVTGITPGTELRFSVYAYIWSSNFDDVDLSESDGDVVVSVGIDPTGGTDGTSGDIVWSPPAIDQYDAYRQYSVIANATSNAVTVFVRSTIDFAVRNNNIYLDDAVLEITEESQPDPTATNTDIPQPSATNTLEPTEVVQVATEEDPTPTPEGPDPTATNTPPISTATSTVTPFNPPFVTTLTGQPTATPDIFLGATETPTNTPDIVDADPTNTAQPAAQVTLDPTVFPNRILHTVRRGDTVGRLAVLYGSTSQAIIVANNLNENGLIFVGQGLEIPVRLPAPATATPTATIEVQVIVVTATPSVVTQVTDNTDVDDVSELGIGGPVAQTYIVQRGDTLSRIASAFNTTVDQLAQLNGIANPNRIQAGQELVIFASATGGPTTTQPAVAPTSPPVPTSPPIVMPVPTAPVSGTLTYIVRPGDNLYRIALRFSVSTRSLQEANNISNVNTIFAGQELIIPPIGS